MIGGRVTLDDGAFAGTSARRGDAGGNVVVFVAIVVGTVVLVLRPDVAPTSNSSPSPRSQLSLGFLPGLENEGSW